MAFLEKGLDALKDDRKGRFNLLLALAGFERATGRTAAARARLEPLVAPDAPPLTRAQRKRVLDLLDAISFDQRANALEDWPAPTLGAEETARIDAADRARADGRPDDAIAKLDPLVRRFPAAARARMVRARALEAVGRVDEAARDLQIAVNLAPSNAEAWRALGKLLASHGGALELDHADEALRQALTLEPAWTDLRALRAQLAKRRAVASATPATGARTPPPTERARAFHQEAEEWLEVGDPIGLGRDLLEKALAESPGFVAAAVSLYALAGSVPPATIAALHDDGPALWALASGVRKLGKADKAPDKAGVVPPKKPPAGKPGVASPRAPDAVEALVQPWIDRAVELDVQEARFSRALTRAAAGDRAGALADLGRLRRPRAEPRPAGRGARAARLAGRAARERPRRAARAAGPHPPARRSPRRGGAGARRHLRAWPGAGSHARAGPGRRVRRPRGDGAALLRAGGRARPPPPGPSGGAPARRRAAPPSIAARWCAAPSGPSPPPSGRWPGLPPPPATSRRRCCGPSGRSRWRRRRPTTPTSGFPTRAPPPRAGRRPRRADEHATETRRQRLGLGALLFGAGGLYAFGRRRWRGKTVAAALRRHPELYPEVARAIGELRHDVLKHRAGVLGMVADPSRAARRDRAGLAGATPDVADRRRPLRPARAGGARGRRRAQAAPARSRVRRPRRRSVSRRDPPGGRVAPPAGETAKRRRDLRGAAPEGASAELLAIDERLRNDHADALGDLLQLGPRTRLDATALATWIAAAEASARQAGGTWAATALALAELDVDFPVAENALGGHLRQPAAQRPAGRRRPARRARARSRRPGARRHRARRRSPCSSATRPPRR